jgi:hypothetical protein
MTISVQFGHELVNESTRCDVELLFAGWPVARLAAPATYVETQ